jgi:2-keto-4-pentenoate hydratase
MTTDQENDAAVLRMRNIWRAARRLRQVWQDGELCAPVRDLIGLEDIEAAYAVQSLNIAQWQAEGRLLMGRKIGATSQAIQEMMGVDYPDFGMLFSDMQVENGTTVPLLNLHQPFVEAEFAVVLKQDLNTMQLTLDDVAQAIDYVLPAIEIIGSRVAGWDLKMPDTIADNASASHFVIGSTPVGVEDVDLFGATTTTYKNRKVASQGNAGNCLGSPLFSLIWLATEARRQGKPLKAGELILTGAMGPIVPVEANDEIYVQIDGLEGLVVCFGAN